MENDMRRRTALTALQLWDVAVFIACLGYSLGLVADGLAAFAAQFGLPELFWWVAASVAWHVALATAKVYHSLRLSRTLQLSRLLFGSALGAICVGALSALLEADGISVPVLAQAWALSLVLTTATRLFLYQALFVLRAHGRNLRIALIVGGGEKAGQLVRKLQQPHAGYGFAGYIDDGADNALSHIHGLRYLGTLDDLPVVLARQVVDEVFITLPVRSFYDRVSRAVIDCENQGIPVRIPIDFFHSSISVQDVNFLDETPVISFVPSPVSLTYVVAKRLIDIAVSATALLVVIPLSVVVALAIRIDSRGPVLFMQQRVGLNKRPFPLLKFRTMHAHSEALLDQLAEQNEADGPVFKIRNDPRITRVGRFLRRFSIDELPQFINVLVGHMSLVGPRPLPLRDVQRFTVDWQRRRFSVKPGLTCLWQISGRSSMAFEQWMKLDMDYIDRRSLLLDIRILFMTVPAVIAQRGAY